MNLTEATGVADNFIKYYYDNFNSSSTRSNLSGLYQPQSNYCFEGQHCQGVEAIMSKISGLQFGNLQTRIDTKDVQLSFPIGDKYALLVCVTGCLLMENEKQPQRFTHIFQLVPHQGGYFILNETFRLNYG